MNKNLFWLIALLFPLSVGFVSCAEDTACGRSVCELASS